MRLRRCLPLLPASLLLAGGFGQIPLGKNHHKESLIPVDQRSYLPATGSSVGSINVDITPAHALNSFAPAMAFGGSIDAISAGSIGQTFSRRNMLKMLSAGHGAISYRLYTELNVQDWHWNPIGTWSDSTNGEGYFTGSSTTGGLIRDSFGYALTHRGSTYDYGSNSKYSNLTDGDVTSYWKSNPYLTSTYTKEPDSLHPQWAFVDLGKVQPIDAIQIIWANPYAVNYEVQYWTGDDPLYDPTNGSWVNFPSGVISNGKGGLVTLRLGPSPTSVQYIRVLMSESSGTFDTHGLTDPRNRMGYAINELGAGTLDAFNVFHDIIVHKPGQDQTTVYVSSTDPWHSKAMKVQDTEQIGLDYVLHSELAQSLPMTIPVPLLYGNPDNAVAEIKYLEAKHAQIIGIELGEEADGQWVTPEDYACLYLQWATAIHSAFPNIKIGGPVTSYNGVQTWTNSSGDSDFLKRFYGYLAAHQATNLLNFVSMEHYPFYQAPLDWSLVPQEVNEVASIFSWVAKAGIPKTIPVYITEYNLSAAPDEPIVDLLGALWHTVFVGEFMNRGGAGSFYYQYLPYAVSSGGTSYGLIGMLLGDDNNQVLTQTSQYFSSRLICQQWCQPGKKTHTVWPATSTIKDASGNQLVLPYVVSRPDGKMAILIVNTDSVSHSVSASFTDTKSHYFTGSVTICQFSSANYTWISNGVDSKPGKDGPYSTLVTTGSSSKTYTLPAHSITVIRGAIK